MSLNMFLATSDRTSYNNKRLDLVGKVHVSDLEGGRSIRLNLTGFATNQLYFSHDHVAAGELPYLGRPSRQQCIPC